MRIYKALVVAGLIAFSATKASAQFGGFWGGSFSSGSSSDRDWWWGGSRSEDAASFTRNSSLPTESTLNVITINDSAKRRLVPEKLRVVFALTSEAATAAECRDALKEGITLIRKDWLTHLKISENDVVEDFVAILPVENWSRKVDGRRKEQGETGFRLQMNLHLSVKNDELAVKAVEYAVRLADANVVTFDYWHSKLDAVRKELRAEAIAEAKEKSDGDHSLDHSLGTHNLCGGSQFGDTQPLWRMIRKACSIGMTGGNGRIRDL